MKILVFTEGTVLMHRNAKGVSRDEVGIFSYIMKLLRKTEPGSPYDYSSYIPVGNAVEKLKRWKSQGTIILYLTSRRIKNEVEAIRNILRKYKFPDANKLYFRNRGEDYEDVAERLLPDVIVEDDCESIGGEKEMTYPYIRADLKVRIKPITVKEFEGIDHLPDNITELLVL